MCLHIERKDNKVLARFSIFIEQKSTPGIGQHQSLNFNKKNLKSYWQVWHQLDQIDDHGLLVKTFIC